MYLCVCLSQFQRYLHSIKCDLMSTNIHRKLLDIQQNNTSNVDVLVSKFVTVLTSEIESHTPLVKKRVKQGKGLIPNGLIQKTKQTYYKHILKMSKGNTRKVWQYRKELSGKSLTTKQINKITENGIELLDKKDIANSLNNDFATAADRVLKNITCNSDDNISNTVYAPSDEFKLFLHKQ